MLNDVAGFPGTSIFITSIFIIRKRALKKDRDSKDFLSQVFLAQVFLGVLKSGVSFYTWIPSTSFPWRIKIWRIVLIFFNLLTSPDSLNSYYKVKVII